MAVSFNKHNHGGQLTQASKRYNIPRCDWLDLSTGINPYTYPLPNVPDECWQRLPESNDGLESAAASYYGSKYLLPVSGSQEAIQKLPLLFTTPLNIGIITPAYHSHKEAWKKAGHNVILLAPDEIDSTVFSSKKTVKESSNQTLNNKEKNKNDECNQNNDLDILLIVNPTNPSAQNYSRDDLLRWHQQLASKNGFLIVDEAFIDSTPEQSLIEETPKSGLIVLRSIGKFFGLAGIRLGFVWAQTELLERLAVQQDDWSVSHPARWAGKKALADRSWQQQQRTQLNESSLRLKSLLHNFLIQYHKKRGEVSFNNELNPLDSEVQHTSLFAYFEYSDAALIHRTLAEKGILTRLFNAYTGNDKTGNQNNAIRFGLASSEAQWLRLEDALDEVTSQLPDE